MDDFRHQQAEIKSDDGEAKAYREAHQRLSHVSASAARNIHPLLLFFDLSTSK